MTRTSTRTRTPSPSPSPSSTATRSLTPTATQTAGRSSTATPTGAATPGVAEEISISGSVMYYTGAAAVSDSVLRVDPEGHSTRTAADGRFSLAAAPRDGQVTLRAEKQGDFRSAVSSLDAVYILQHVVGDRQLGDRQQAACDVTGDGRVTALDATRVLELVVGEIDRFPAAIPCQSDWMFAIEGQPFSCDRPLAMEPGGALQIEALLAGDCTGNWQGDGPAARQLGEGRVRSAPRVRVGRLRRRGSRALLPIYIRAARPYHSIDLEVEHLPEELVAVRARVLGDRAGTMVQIKTQSDGRTMMAVANPGSINRSRRQVIVLEFEVQPNYTTGWVQVRRLRIDEKTPRISQLRR